MKRLHLYYNMKLVTFGIDRKQKSYCTIPNFHATLFTTTINIIYQLEMVPVAIIDKNTTANSYTKTPDKETLYSIKFRNV